MGNGDVCAPKTIKLPMALGTITWDGLECPVAKGAVSVGVDVQLSKLVPARLAKGTIEIKAAGASKESLLCMDIKTSSASDQIIVVWGSNVNRIGLDRCLSISSCPTGNFYH